MKGNTVFNLDFSNGQAVWLALVPALLNLGILFYVLRFLPKNKLSHIFALFLLSLTIWQTSDVFERMSVTVEGALFWSKALGIGALLIIPAGMHFALLFIGRLKKGKALGLLTLLYFPALFFYSLNSAILDESFLLYNEQWGWVSGITDHPILLIESMWISLLALVMLGLLISNTIKMWGNNVKRYQALLLAVGFGLPMLQGIITQVIFPEFFKIESIPVASTFMTIFSIATIISLVKFKLLQIPFRLASGIILDTINDILLIVSSKGELQFINPFGSKMMGIKEEELENFSVKDVFPDIDPTFNEFRDKVWTPVFNKVTTDEYYTFFQTVEKKKFPVMISATAIENPDGSISMLMLVHDITARKEAEEHLQESEERFQLLVKKITDYAIFMLDPSGYIMSWNEGAERIKGYTEEEIIGKHISVFYTPDDVKAGIPGTNLKNALESGHFEGEGWRVRKDGTLLRAKVMYTTMYDASGRLSGFSKLTQDITKQRETEKQIRESNEQIETIVSNAPNAIVVMNERGQIVKWNLKAEQVFGWKSEEILGRQMHKVIMPERYQQRHQKGFEHFLATGQGPAMNKILEVEALRKNKEEFPVELSISATTVGGHHLFIAFINDISERVESEKQLKKQTELYESMLRAQSEMGEGVAITEGATFVYVNDALSKIYGYTREELLAMSSFMDMVVPEQKESMVNRLRERMKGSPDVPYSGQLTVMNKNGERVDIAYSLKMFVQGERQQIFSIIRDISEQKLSEQKLSESEAQLAAAQHLAHLGSWEWDLVKNSLTWSDELYRIFGLVPQEKEITYDMVFAMTHIGDRTFVKEIITESREKLHSFNFYHRIVLADKSVRTLHARGEVIFDQAGNALKMVGTDQDVTDRIKEEELEKLAVAATKSFNSVIIADRNGIIEWVNEGFEKLTCYTLEEVVSTHGELLRKGNETGLSEETDFHNYVINEKKPVTYESKNFTKSGKEYWVITTLTPVLDKEGIVEKIIAIDTDITPRKKMEEDLINANKIAEHSLMKGNRALDELLKAKRQVEESMKVKEQFLANMSHEIRTPMNAIVGFTDLILKTPLAGEQLQYVDAIKTSGENLIVIINDILDFSKIQSGKITFEQINFRLSQTISNVTEMMLPRSIEKNIKLSSVIDKQIPDHLIGDPTRLNQVLLNLVGNAIKFTEKGEVKITIELVKEDKENVELKFYVTDSGIGIPHRKLSSIFDEFTQAANDTTRKYGGSGLGLAIVRQLVEMQGGKVSVTSKTGKGSTFGFVLSFRKNLNPERFHANLYVEEDSAQLVEGLNVLLVEDNILNQVLAKKVLTDWHWNVELAVNGLVAVEKLKQQDFDIILMDIQLPEMDGYEATRYIRNKMPSPKNKTPIMAMTAHAISSEEQKCYDAGMDGYISKPFNQKALYNRILAVIKAYGYAGGQTGTGKVTVEEKTNHMKHTNLSYLEELSNGSDKFMTEMIGLFIEKTPEALEKMQTHLQNKDWPALRGIAHKMKPSISFVGLKEIETDLSSVEELAEKEQDLEQLPQMIDKIIKVCQAAIEELKEDLKQYI